MGANDYFSKPFTREELLSRVLFHLELSLYSKKLKMTMKELEELNKNLEDKVEQRTAEVEARNLFKPMSGVSGDFTEYFELLNTILIYTNMVLEFTPFFINIICMNIVFLIIDSPGFKNPHNEVEYIIEITGQMKLSF
ncbi:MAG: hypothetical protein GY754_14305 [bacterium]|nr:hypothetical protein [bacterium]